jgi:hypothetical protein
MRQHKLTNSVVPEPEGSSLYSQSNRQNYGFVYFNIYIHRQQAERQETLDRMVESFPEFSLLLISSRMQF